MKNVIIAGGSGLIGRELARYLYSKNYNISILTRNPASIKNFKAFYWNPKELLIDDRAFRQQDYLINLAGESIASKYWTSKRKNEILQSRIQSIQTLAKGIQNANNKQIKIITASAIGFYGNRPNEVLTENSNPGTGFLADVCKKWEETADKLLPNAIKIRIGIVLSNKGGYLPQIRKMVRKHLNVILGDGKQKTSWIHISDLVRAIHRLMLNNSKTTYNLCSPKPGISEIMQNYIAANEQARAFKIKIPANATKIFLREFSELFLNSQEVIPASLLKDDFQFQFPDLDLALKDLGGYPEICS